MNLSISVNQSPDGCNASAILDGSVLAGLIVTSEDTADVAVDIEASGVWEPYRVATVVNHDLDGLEGNDQAALALILAVKSWARTYGFDAVGVDAGLVQGEGFYPSHGFTSIGDQGNWVLII